MNGRRPFPISD